MLVVEKKIDYLKKVKMRDGLRGPFKGVVYYDVVLWKNLGCPFLIELYENGYFKVEGNRFMFAFLARYLLESCRYHLGRDGCELS